MGARVAALPTSRRSRLALLLVALAVAFAAFRGFAAWRDTSSLTTKPSASTSPLPTRTLEAGAVTLKIEPRQLNAQGAVFKITFDTHSVELNQDLTRQARLTVGGTKWNAAAWSGDGPGGHHREGQLRFTSAGPATGTATLTIDGLPAPATATWNL
ncbi:MAG TPA: hypothetical protein VHD87_02550 [Acidimicrobiales bacterium]|nr:hypothetical protein [Acidimicrobiales bacterium]